MYKLIHQYRNKLAAISGIMIAAGVASGASGWENLRNGLLIAATITAGLPIAVKAFQALRMKAFSIELLVTVAVIGALIIHEYIESSVVTFLFLFGAYLESRTLERTRSSLQELVDMAPQEATVIRDGGTVTIAAEEVKAGDRFIVRSGGKIPADGIVVSGAASLNEAAITGESVPVTKRSDDRVYSGTMADSGYIEVIADKVGDDTTFAKIIELVEEAQEAKSPAEKFLDRFARYYTPVIILIAVIVYAFTLNLHLAITFLVVACPGALVIGAPVSSVAGIGNGARNGVLIKGGEVLDKLAKVDVVVFDKTGTLTKGAPAITDIRVFGSCSRDELLRLTAEAESISEHHLGRTIVKAAEAGRLPLRREVADGEVIKGGGIRATVEGHMLIVGNRKLMNGYRIPIDDDIREYAELRERSGNTAVYIAIDGRLAGVISIMDQIREDAEQSLEQLKLNGVKKLVMLTGDNHHTAMLVADQLGIDQYHGELLPEDKVAYIRKLQAEGYTVAMAGDGINDAPAIATSDIGLAMGEGGTDISMETADIVLMADKLSQFSHAYALAKATVRNMKQNTLFAVVTVGILLVGVLSGDIHLASGMFIHEASVLFVILNAMRLMRFGKQRRAKIGQVMEVTD